ncbi:MAG: hypothetical protein R2712_28135 [Vicinamibacterales bacterium]
MTLAGAPDSRRGVYLFRVGLDTALGALRLTPGGPSCELVWDEDARAAVRR